MKYYDCLHLPQILLCLGRLTLRTRVVRESTGARLGPRNVALELVRFVLDSIEVLAAWTVLLHVLVVDVVIVVVVGAR